MQQDADVFFPVDATAKYAIQALKDVFGAGLSLYKKGKQSIERAKAEEKRNFDKEEFEKQGITYRHFPVANPIDIDFDELKSLEKDIKETDGKLYIYCMSGNRVSGILARFFVEVCGHPKERVLDAITKLQMIRPDLLEATKIKLS